MPYDTDTSSLSEIKREKDSQFEQAWQLNGRIARVEACITALYNEMPDKGKYPCHNEAFAATIAWLEDVAGELRAERRASREVRP